MSNLEPSFPKRDRELEKRRALAKVYALLIRLAEEAEARRQSEKPDVQEKSEDTSQTGGAED